MKKLQLLLSVLLCALFLIPFSACNKEPQGLGTPNEDGSYNGNGIVAKYIFERRHDEDEGFFELSMTLLFTPDTILQSEYHFIPIDDYDLEISETASLEDYLRYLDGLDNRYTPPLDTLHTDNRQSHIYTACSSATFCILIYDKDNDDEGFSWMDYISILYI